MKTQLATKTQLAKMCGVTQAAVTKFIKGKGGVAVVGERIDISHPIVKEYIDKKCGTGVDAKLPPPAPLEIKTPPGSQVVEIPQDIESVADWTVREVVEKYGTMQAFVDFLKAIKEIEGVNEKRIKNAEASGKLVSRKLVEVGVIDVFNTAHMKLLTDGSKTIAASLMPKVKAGAELAELEAHVSDIIGSFIKPVKNKIRQSFKDLSND